jgi:hypothetical protein
LASNPSLKSTFPSCFITHTGATRSDFGVNTCEAASVSHPPSMLALTFSAAGATPTQSQKAVNLLLYIDFLYVYNV